MNKYTCRCGRNIDILKSYFTKNGARVTVCDFCAEKYKLTDEKKFTSVEYKPIVITDANNK